MNATYLCGRGQSRGSAEGYSTLFVCQSVCVSDTTLQASVVKGTLKFRHQRSVNNTLQSFDSWILLTMLGSRDMTKFVSQEAYDGASLPETSVHVINHMLLQFVIEHVLFFVRFPTLDVTWLWWYGSD